MGIDALAPEGKLSGLPEWSSEGVKQLNIGKGRED